MSDFRAALLQMRSGMDIGRNVEAFSKMVHEAAANGATYVQSPEMTGALVRDRAALKAMLKDEAADPVAAAASDLARSLGIHVHVGSTAIAAEGGKVANRAFLFGPDGFFRVFAGIVRPALGVAGVEGAGRVSRFQLTRPAACRQQCEGRRDGPAPYQTSCEF